MSRMIKHLPAIAIRAIIYFAVAVAALYVMTHTAGQSPQVYQVETLRVVQQRMYLLTLDKIDPDVPEFNALRASLMQRIYDFSQRPSIGSTNFDQMLKQIYELDSVLDRVYFYNPAQDLIGKERSVQAARARAANDGLSEVEQRLSQLLADTELDQFAIQLDKVKSSLTALLDPAADAAIPIDNLTRDYDILIDVAWDLELSPLASQSGRQHFDQITEWLAAR